MCKNHIKCNPEVSINDYKRFYVVPAFDDRRGVKEAIYADLKSRGFNVEIGPAIRIPDNTDVKLTYEAKWMWDITFYLYDLIINFKDPQNDIVIAFGQSHRPSLERKSVDEMVKEILDQIYGVSPQKKE